MQLRQLIFNEYLEVVSLNISAVGYIIDYIKAIFLTGCMIQLKDFINLDQILVNVEIASKKRALEELAKAIVINHKGLNIQQVFDRFIEREKLGSTGFGNGVAIPHCRLMGCQEPIVAILKLSTAIDFDSIDDQLVDILIALAVPEQATDEHLLLLKQIAELLSNTEICQNLRTATSNDEIYRIIVNSFANNT